MDYPVERQLIFYEQSHHVHLNNVHYLLQSLEYYLHPPLELNDYKFHVKFHYLLLALYQLDLDKVLAVEPQ
ncbi:Uncharacterised protein [Mycobacteroides abscessus subsp. abscessus]|nr:Uncharacterised protein [Mycobacteroides abscessus subsp. abscessus]